MALGPIFIFCALGLVFGGTEVDGSRFHALRARTFLRRYRGRRFTFSSFARPNSFSSVPRTSGPIFIFCAPGLVFGGAECVGCHFHVSCSRNHFRRCRVRSGPVFMFCAPRLVLGGAECVWSRFHVLRDRTNFRLYQGRQVPFACFVRPYSFSTVQRASCPVFMF
jgi:hypothetical protein